LSTSSGTSWRSEGDDCNACEDGTDGEDGAVGLTASVDDEEAAAGFESATGANGLVLMSSALIVAESSAAPDFNGCDCCAGEATAGFGSARFWGIASAAASALRRSFTFFCVGTFGSTRGASGFGASEERETGFDGSTGDGCNTGDCDTDKMEAFELGTDDETGFWAGVDIFTD